MNILLIDNYDSFTFMLKDYIEQCGFSSEVIRNDADLLSLETDSYQALIISPGPGTPEQAGVLLPFMKKQLNHKPILGICLGHQAIGVLMGARLEHALLPRHGKVDPVFHEGDAMFEGIRPSFEATRYHSLLLTHISDPLKITAKTQQGEVMAIRHQHLPIWGIQFHPESCMTFSGMQIIQNFLGQAVPKS